MKKVIFALGLLIVISLLIVGCSEKVKTTAPEESVLQKNTFTTKYNEFTSKFNELLSKLPEYTIRQAEDVPLETDSVCHQFYIEDTVLNDTYRLRVDTNKDSEITWVFLSTERKSYGNLQFAVFSLYAYEAMGFPEIDADSFYDKYDLFSKEKILESDICEGYKISSYTIDITTEITFSIRATDK